jgi:spore maturation protein CgeB
MSLYADFEQLVESARVDAVVVCDAPPYHPDYLKRFSFYKVLFSHDDPESTYLRNIPYLHAYNHVFYVTSAYTRDMDMPDKLLYCGAHRADRVPCGLMSFDYDSSVGETELLSRDRDIDVLFVGAFYRRKLDLLVRLAKTFGRSFEWYGHVRTKHNLYMTVKYLHPFRVVPVSFSERLRLHQRARIGVNIHNGYDVPNFGNQRCFYVPANGAMLLTDGDKHVSSLYERDREAVSYTDGDELISKARYYLDHEAERVSVARNGYRRVMKDYRFVDITRHTGQLIERGMDMIGWRK